MATSAEQWDAAWRAVDALPDADKSRPEIRYVRARIAMARGEAAAALPLLEGLDTALPLLVDDLARRRHEAMLVAGPFDDAGTWFATRSTPEAQLDAARAFEKAKDARRARVRRSERVLAADKRTRAQEERSAWRCGCASASTRASRAATTERADASAGSARWERICRRLPRGSR